MTNIDRNIILKDAFRIESPDLHNISTVKIKIETDSSHSITCTKHIESIFEKIEEEIKKDDLNNCCVVIVDFENVASISDDVLEKYIEYCLTTKYKVFSINMFISVSQAYSGILEDTIHINN